MPTAEPHRRDPSRTHTVRELSSADPVVLIELFEAVLPGFSERLAADGSGPTTFLADPASFAFGAYVDEVPAGLAWGVQIRYPNGRLVTYLHELDVREEFRRRRIASGLIKSSMELARRRGSSRFWLSTGGHNHPAQALYESLNGERKPLGDVNYWWHLD